MGEKKSKSPQSHTISFRNPPLDGSVFSLSPKQEKTETKIRKTKP